MVHMLVEGGTGTALNLVESALFIGMAKGKRQGDDSAGITKKPRVVTSAEALTCDACGKKPKDQ
eukprot:1954364-Amphidinium_carterae.1